MFVDYAQVEVEAGHGGTGCVSFRREKYVPLGGPDGGDGGKGGDVIILGNTNLTTLMDQKYRRHYRAKRGAHGQGSNKTGRNGADVVISVPLGTIVREDDTVLADITKQDERFIAARGGRGGMGNTRQAKPTDQAPAEWKQGQPGEKKSLILELKILADVGLIGFPNAGKSTLLSVLSKAKPKIADYPFTTLYPNIGICNDDNFFSYAVADIPGLVEGAHRGKGLGLQFLKHIERTRLLVFLIDAGSENPLQDYESLIAEINHYNSAILKNPRIVCLSKVDVNPDYVEKGRRFRHKVLYISSMTNKGIPELKAAIGSHLTGKTPAHASSI